MPETYLKIDRTFMNDLKKQYGGLSRLRFMKACKQFKKQYGEDYTYSSYVENNGIHVPGNNWDQESVYSYNEIESMMESEKAYTFVTKKQEFVFVGKDGLNEVAFKTFVKRLFDAHILKCGSLPASF